MPLYEIEPHECISGALLQQVKAFNRDLEALENEKANLIAMRKGILDADPLSVDPASLSATRERLTSGYLATLKREAELANRFNALSTEMVDAAETAMHAADEESSNVLQKVIGKMAEAGITVKSMLGWGKDPRSAQKQLEHQAKTSSDFKEAQHRMTTIREFSRSINEQRRNAMEALNTARENAKRLIEKAVAGDSAGLQLM